MTTLSTSPRSPEPVWRDVDGSLFAASAVLHHQDAAARVQVVGDPCPSTAPVLRNMLDRLRLMEQGGSLSVEHAEEAGPGALLDVDGRSAR